ncbi:alpha/beta hydrolase [Solwaraspora sp. WMMD1047]|uniref:alpha/beta fold hydrolase n=1 Tax=Solwaraspora sp. WMMD1047 TaxID=3016102 RepID=UPI002416579C|nr:alpha/beta hydrolase [Solwaraspora sp. WMMD1047]MDG4831695.1 alpha/beta hydrolase [Solwaraspora sp. WMMD1047]
MTGTVSVDVIREAVGPAAITVGLIHGLGSSTSVWTRLAEALPSPVRVWAYRLPWDATDGSGWATERDSQVWLDRALRLAPQPDVYLAHSFGANVLLDRLVAAGTANCRGLVLMSPFYRPSPLAFDWATITHYLNDFDDLVRSGIRARRGGPPDELLEAMVAKVRERIGPYGWMRFFDLFTRTPFLDLRAVDVPCLVIGGGRDTASYPHDCESLATALPNARLEILPDCGHFTMIDETARVAELVVDFLHQLGCPAGRDPAAEGAAI